MRKIMDKRDRDDNLVVLLMGKKRAGKNTAARVIRERMEGEEGWVVQEFAFGDELRRHLSTLNPIVGMTNDEVPDGRWPFFYTQPLRWNDAVERYGYEAAKSSFPEMRRLMQTYGTEVVRDRVNDNYWAEYVQRQVVQFNLEANGNGFKSLAIITDARFNTELDVFGYRCYDLGTVEVLGVTRPDVDDGDGHASNADLDTIIGPEEFIVSIVNNSGTLEEFEEKVRWIWQGIATRKNIPTKKESLTG